MYKKLVIYSLNVITCCGIHFNSNSSSFVGIYKYVEWQRYVNDKKSKL